jgi:hypothetical protein
VAPGNTIDLFRYHATEVLKHEPLTTWAWSSIQKAVLRHTISYLFQCSRTCASSKLNPENKMLSVSRQKVKTQIQKRKKRTSMAKTTLLKTASTQKRNRRVFMLRFWWVANEAKLNEDHWQRLRWWEHENAWNNQNQSQLANIAWNWQSATGCTLYTMTRDAWAWRPKYHTSINQGALLLMTNVPYDTRSLDCLTTSYSPSISMRTVLSARVDVNYILPSDMRH